MTCHHCTKLEAFLIGLTPDPCETCESGLDRMHGKVNGYLKGKPRRHHAPKQDDRAYIMEVLKAKRWDVVCERALKHYKENGRGTYMSAVSKDPDYIQKHSRTGKGICLGVALVNREIRYLYLVKRRD